MSKMSPPMPLIFHKSVDLVNAKLQTVNKCNHKECSDCSDDLCPNVARHMECPPGCKTGCQNQKFRKQEGLPQVFVKNCGPAGNGLFHRGTSQDGTFIIPYIGEVISATEREKRRVNYTTQGKPNYFFTTQNDNFTIDPTAYGNAAMFANHSCNPNMVAVEWKVDGAPAGFRAIGFMAEREIGDGEQLTIDYGEEYAEGMRCFCGSKRCSGLVGKKKLGKDDAPTAPDAPESRDDAPEYQDGAPDAPTAPESHDDAPESHDDASESKDDAKDAPDAPTASESQDDAPDAPDSDASDSNAPDAPDAPESQDDAPDAPDAPESRDEAPESQDDAPDAPFDFHDAPDSPEFQDAPESVNDEVESFDDRDLDSEPDYAGSNSLDAPESADSNVDDAPNIDFEFDAPEFDAPVDDEDAPESIAPEVQVAVDVDFDAPNDPDDASDAPLAPESRPRRSMKRRLRFDEEFGRYYEKVAPEVLDDGPEDVPRKRCRNAPTRFEDQFDTYY